MLALRAGAELERDGYEGPDDEVVDELGYGEHNAFCFLQPACSFYLARVCVQERTRESSLRCSCDDVSQCQNMMYPQPVNIRSSAQLAGAAALAHAVGDGLLLLLLLLLQAGFRPDSILS